MIGDPFDLTRHQAAPGGDNNCSSAEVGASDLPTGSELNGSSVAASACGSAEAEDGDAQQAPRARTAQSLRAAMARPTSRAGHRLAV